MEAEHPLIKMYCENPNSQMNVYNNLMVVNRIDPKNVSHYIVGHKCTEEKSYLKIRTNPDNPTIINAILAGRKPAFSIRVRADFQEQADGTRIANKIDFITADFVANPANATAFSMPAMKAIDPCNQKEVDLTLIQKTGTESVSELLKEFLGDEGKIFYDTNSTGFESIMNMRIVKPSKEKDFEKLFALESYSFL